MHIAAFKMVEGWDLQPFSISVLVIKVIYFAIYPKMTINLPRTNGKLNCKLEPYRFSGWQDTSAQTDDLIILHKDFARGLLLLIFSLPYLDISWKLI